MERETRRYVWMLGLAGLGRNVGWGMNKVFTALLLGALTPSTQLVGSVLGAEGLFGILLNPLAGWLSDRYPTRIGRRRPYLFVAFPGAAAMLVLMYLARSLPLAILATLLFYFFQQLSATPYQAMMPESVAEREYGEASGILNFLWTLGNLVAFLVVPLVYAYVGHAAAFLFGAAVLLLGGLSTAAACREEGAGRAAARRPSGRPLRSTSLLKYYVAQGFWWLGFEAIASFFTPYMVHVLHGSVLDSALGMSIFTVAGIAVSLWFGRLYQRRDARLLLAVTLILFAAASLAGLWITSVAAAFVVLFVAGAAWGGIQVTSYPLAADMLRQELRRRGRSEEAARAEAARLHGALYGGVNLVQSLGLMVAAPLAGQVIALSDGRYQAMFLVSCGSLLLALAIVLLFGRVEVAQVQAATPVEATPTEA
ncbi:MAG: MFS transporter [Bacillota bacterium]|nr:MFS transporter [Bacillota bacterium]